MIEVSRMVTTGEMGAITGRSPMEPSRMLENIYILL